jgi:hypothetical protein
MVQWYHKTEKMSTFLRLFSPRPHPVLPGSEKAQILYRAFPVDSGEGFLYNEAEAGPGVPVPHRTLTGGLYDRIKQNRGKHLPHPAVGGQKAA